MRWDDRALGLVTGLSAPVVGFLVYGLIYTELMHPHLDLGYFIHDLFLGTRRFQAPVLTLSLIADVPLFFLYDKLGRFEAMRGVVVSMFLYGALIIALWI